MVNGIYGYKIQTSADNKDMDEVVVYKCQQKPHKIDLDQEYIAKNVCEKAWNLLLMKNNSGIFAMDCLLGMDSPYFFVDFGIEILVYANSKMILQIPKTHDLLFSTLKCSPFEDKKFEIRLYIITKDQKFLKVFSLQQSPFNNTVQIIKSNLIGPQALQIMHEQV